MNTEYTIWPRRAGKTAAAEQARLAERARIETPQTIASGALLGALVADADGHQRDRRKARDSGPGLLRSEFMVTPAGELVSAHRTAL